MATTRSRTAMMVIYAPALLIAVSSIASAAPCDSLGRLTLPNTTITSARLVAPGAFHLRAGARRPSAEIFTAFDRLPAFCRVQATLTPSADSHIELEVWLPAAGWNGKYLGVGNGGFAGSISYFRLGEAVNSGYASASTDTGHKGLSRDSQWSIGHPEKQIDFDYRAIHGMTEVAKAAIHAFYGRGADHSYFNACSNGGRQGLMEAERYPTDYDGIMAGAPATRFGFSTFVSGDFAAFQKRGGKIIIYHGGNDRPAANLDFFSTVHRRMGDSTVDNFLQFYLLPGMGHCGSG